MSEEKEKEVNLKLGIDEFHKLVEMIFLGNMIVNGSRNEKLKEYSKVFSKVAALFKQVHMEDSATTQGIKLEGSVKEYLSIMTDDFIYAFYQDLFYSVFADKMAEYYYEGYDGVELESKENAARKVYLEELNTNGLMNVSIFIVDFQKKLEACLAKLKNS